jgi:hypothetical protein
MAHVNGGYVITTRTKNVESEHDVDQKTLKEIAKLLGVTEVDGQPIGPIRTILVYGDPRDVP